MREERQATVEAHGPEDAEDRLLVAVFAGMFHIPNHSRRGLMTHFAQRMMTTSNTVHATNASSAMSKM
jgi:hypothetical protein